MKTQKHLNVSAYNFTREVMIMGIVLIVSAIIGLALLCYLFYILFEGENL